MAVPGNGLPSRWRLSFFFPALTAGALSQQEVTRMRALCLALSVLVATGCASTQRGDELVLTYYYVDF